MVLVELGQQGKWMLLNSVDDMGKWKQIFNSEHDTFSRIYDGMCNFSSLDWRMPGEASHMKLLHAVTRHIHRHQNGFGSYILGLRQGCGILRPHPRMLVMNR